MTQQEYDDALTIDDLLTALNEMKLKLPLGGETKVTLHVDTENETIELPALSVDVRVWVGKDSLPDTCGICTIEE